MATVKQVVSACVHFKLIYCPAEVVATKINAVARAKLERKKNADAIEQARQVTIPRAYDFQFSQPWRIPAARDSDSLYYTRDSHR